MPGEDKMRHKGEELKGRVKEGAGRATDDEQLEREGRTDKTKGNVKQAGDKAKDAIKGAFGKE